MTMMSSSPNSMWKFNAYREVATNYEVARDIIYQKRLAYGEAAIVPYYYPDRSSEDKKVQNLVGIGALDGDVMFISDMIGGDTNIDNATVTVDGIEMTVKDAFAYVMRGGSSEQIAESINRMNDNLSSVLGEIRDALGGTSKNDTVKETVFVNPTLTPKSTSGNRYSYEWVINTSDYYVNQSFYTVNMIDALTGEVIIPTIKYAMDEIKIMISLTKTEENEHYFNGNNIKPNAFRAIVIASCGRNDSSASQYEQLLGMIDEINRTDERQNIEITNIMSSIEPADNRLIDELFDENQNDENNENE